MANYEDLVKLVLERVDSGAWEGKSQVNFTHEYGDLVNKVIGDGYVELIGGFWERSKDGVHYQGKFVITDKGKELLGK